MRRSSGRLCPLQCHACRCRPCEREEFSASATRTLNVLHHMHDPRPDTAPLTQTNKRPGLFDIDIAWKQTHRMAAIRCEAVRSKSASRHTSGFSCTTRSSAATAYMLPGMLYPYFVASSDGRKPLHDMPASKNFAQAGMKQTGVLQSIHPTPTCRRAEHAASLADSCLAPVSTTRLTCVAGGETATAIWQL